MTSDELFQAITELTASAVIDLAVSACEVQADLESENVGAHDAWSGVAARLTELRELARKIEDVPCQKRNPSRVEVT